MWKYILNLDQNEENKYIGLRQICWHGLAKQSPYLLLPCVAGMHVIIFLADLLKHGPRDILSEPKTQEIPSNAEDLKA